MGLGLAKGSLPSIAIVETGGGYRFACHLTCPIHEEGKITWGLPIAKTVPKPEVGTGRVLSKPT